VESLPLIMIHEVIIPTSKICVIFYNTKKNINY